MKNLQDFITEASTTGYYGFEGGKNTLPKDVEYVVVFPMGKIAMYSGKYLDEVIKDTEGVEASFYKAVKNLKKGAGWNILPWDYEQDNWLESAIGMCI